MLTLDVLKHAKRFHATVSFLADTGLKESVDQVQKYNVLMKDFPLNELLSATDLESIRDAIILIFSHVNKKLKICPYPIRRALALMDAVSKDFADQLLKVLGKRRLMSMDYGGGFERTVDTCLEVFRVWDDVVKDFSTVAREVTRKRSEKFIPIKINAAHAKLQERLEFLLGFRRKHQQLRDTITKVVSQPSSSFGTAAAAATAAMTEQHASVSDLNALDEIDGAYECVKYVDVLDVTPGSLYSAMCGC